MIRRRALLAAAPLLATPFVARAAGERVRVGVFDSSSALPFYVARERGIFEEFGIAPAATSLQTHPLTVQALVAGDLDACANLVSLEAANINARRAGTVTYFALNGQNAEYLVEQFLVRPASTATSLRDLKGARILSAPGPANMSAAKAVLASVGLRDGADYTLTEQPLGVHVGALAAGQFDAAYTLEPVASIAVRQGAAKRLEGGVIATHLLGRRDALAFAAGAGLTQKMIDEKPDLARRWAAAWAKSLATIAADPAGTRAYLTPFMNTPADLAPTVPLAAFRLVRDLTPVEVADFQKFVDLAVAQGVVRGAISVSSFTRAL